MRSRTGCYTLTMNEHPHRARKSAPRALVVIGSIVVLASLVAACTTNESSKAAPATTVPSLPPDMMAIVNSPEYAHGDWHWEAQELGTGKTLFARNENELNFLGSTT